MALPLPHLADCAGRRAYNKPGTGDFPLIIFIHAHSPRHAVPQPRLSSLPSAPCKGPCHVFRRPCRPPAPSSDTQLQCDEGRPSCQRCVARQERCVGYRDDSDLIFQDETAKVTQKFKWLNDGPLPLQGAVSRRTSAGHLSSRSILCVRKGPFPYEPGPSAPAQHDVVEPDKQAAWDFMDSFVIYPCEGSSTPGFLEHLPSLFGEVNVKGRYALRWAVQAAASADLSRNGNDRRLATKALESYGHALVALEKSLARQGKEPDDHDLMTVVMLDIFEVCPPQSPRYVCQHAVFLEY